MGEGEEVYLVLTIPQNQREEAEFFYSKTFARFREDTQKSGRPTNAWIPPPSSSSWCLVVYVTFFHFLRLEISKMDTNLKKFMADLYCEI